MSQIKWTNVAGGDFNTGGNWMGGAVPGSTDDALLTTLGTYTVTTNASDTVNSLQMISTVTFDINGGTFTMLNGSGSGTDNGLIAINGNNTLAVGGTLAGSGTVQLNTNGYACDFVVNSATTTLSGGGKIILSDSGANRIYAGTAGNVLNNVSDTISGSGQLGVDQTGLDNQTAGTIDATGLGTALVLDLGAYAGINAGLIEATAAAGLVIQNSAIANTGGTIKAVGAGDNVYLSSATITGGSLTTTGGGVIETVGGNNATLSGVTITAGSTVSVNNNSTLYLNNTITNKGTISITTDGYGDQLVANTATVTLTGGGVIQMTDSGANYIDGSATGGKLINVNNKISGSGQIGGGLVLDNQAAGVINASGPGTSITIQSVSMSNEGLLEDTNTGGLNINGTTITNTGTILATGSGSYVSLYNNADIVGGKLATTNAGIIETVGGNIAMLDGSTATGAVTITAGSTVAVQNNSTLNVAGSIVNLGTIQLNTDGYTNEMVVNGPSVTFTGGGHITLSDSGANYIFGAVGTDKLINFNNIISGSGQLGSNQLTIDNQAAGVIDATGTVAGLTIYATAFTNEGLVEATGPAGLGIDATTLVNHATLAAIGSTVNLYNSAIVEGGTLESSAGGYLFTGNTSTLDGTTNGALTLTSGSSFDINGNTTLDLVGSIVNSGTIAMNADGYSNDLIVNSATVTLSGGGTIAMNDVGSNRIYGAVATNLLVNVNDTITGSGQIGVAQGSFDNQALGVIDATGTNSGLTINATSFTNEGLIEATNTAGLGIQATTLVNSGTLLASGTSDTINVYNSSVIEGGTLISNAGGYFVTSNTGTLDGATNGALTITAGSLFDINGNVTLDLMGTIVNHGTIGMNADGYNNDLIANSPTVTLTGGGTIAMNDVGSNRIYGALSTDVFANVNNTIMGSGQIGSGQGTIDNQSAGIIDATGTSSGLILNANYFSNEGLIEATNTGGVTIQTSIVNSGTLATVGGGNNINLVSGASIKGGTLTGSGGGFFETTNAGTLDGATNGPLTITSTASFDINGNVTLYVGGSIVNQGIIEMSADGYNNDLIVNTPTVALSGGGSLILSDQGANRVYGAVTADKLVNVSNTISGAGQLGAGQLTLDNQKAGIIDATGTGTNLNISLGSTFTNEGLVEASGPAGLLIQNATLTNTGTIAALSGSNVNINSTTTITNYTTGALNTGTLTGGTWEASSAGGGATSTLSLATGNITTDAAHLIISGTGAAITTSGTSVVTTLSTIAAGGELDVLGGATFASGNTLTDSGKILLAGTFSALALTTTPAGSITATGSATLSTTGKLVNNGTLAAISGGKLLLTGGTLSSTGTVIANAGGTVNLTATERNTNLAAGKLSHGTWEASGNGATLFLSSGTVTNDAAIITLSGAGSSIKTGGAAKTLESTLNTVSAASQLNVLNTRGFASTVATGISDSGTIALGGATFSDTSLTITAGGTFLGGGTLTGPVSDAGSLIASTTPAGSTGTLTLTGAVSGAGLLSASTGTVLNTAGYTVGTLNVVGGTVNGGGTVTGAVTDGGTLALGATGTLSAGSLTVQVGATASGASFIASGAIADSGVIALSGGTLSGSSITLATAGSKLTGYGTVAQSVANTGTIDASGGTLTLAAGETGGALFVEAGASLVAGAAVAATSLTIAAGGNFIGAGGISGATVDNGSITTNGVLSLATTSGTGNATITSGTSLDAGSALKIAGVTFASGSNETLQLGTASGDTAVISGFAAGTTIDLLNTVVTSYSYSAAKGQLGLKSGATVLGALTFAGTYGYGNFHLQSDGNGGTDITYAATAAASPIDDLHAAVAATSGSAQLAGVTPAGAAAAAGSYPQPSYAAGGADPTLAPSHGFEPGLLHVAVA